MICFAALLALAAVYPAARAQAPADSGAVIRTETKLVLVDTVVTDKKGNYIHDLEAKDFKVWEDNKEQQIKSFSFEAGSASPSNPQKHYLVLFFDNSTMDFGAQGARPAGRDQIHRRQRRPESPDGDCQFRRRAPNRAEFHRRRAAAEECCQRGQIFRRLAQCIGCERAATQRANGQFWRARRAVRVEGPGQEPQRRSPGARL